MLPIGLCSVTGYSFGTTHRARAVRMQFEEETTDWAAARAASGGLFDRARSTIAESESDSGSGSSVPADEVTDVQHGVRALGFGAGGLVGNLLVSAIDTLSGGSTPATIRAPTIDDSGLYNAVLPLVESGTIPTPTLPGFIQSINRQANEKYNFGPPPTTAPATSMAPLPESSGLLSSASDTGGSAIDQLASALSMLPQPAAAAVPPMEASALDSVSFTLAGGIGFAGHLFVPLVCGVIGALAFELLVQQDDEVGVAIQKAGRAADLAGQKVVGLVRSAASRGASADALGNTDSAEPTSARRMPWEED